MTLPQDKDKKKKIVTLRSILEESASNAPAVNLDEVFTPDEEETTAKAKTTQEKQISEETTEEKTDTAKIPTITELPEDIKKIIPKYPLSWQVEIPEIKPTDATKIQTDKGKIPTKDIDRSLSEHPLSWLVETPKTTPTDTTKDILKDIDKKLSKHPYYRLFDTGKSTISAPTKIDSLSQLKDTQKYTPKWYPMYDIDNIIKNITTTPYIDSSKETKVDTSKNLPVDTGKTISSIPAKVDSLDQLSGKTQPDTSALFSFDPDKMLENIKSKKAIVESVSTKVDPTSIIKQVREREQEKLKEQLEIARKQQKEKGIKIRIYDEKGNEYEPYYGVANALTTTIHNLLYPEDKATRPEMAYGTITQALMSGEASVMGMYQSTLDFGDYAYQYLIKPVFGKEPEPERIKREYRETLKKPPVAKITPIIPKKDVSIEELYSNAEKDTDFDLSFRLNYAKNFFIQKGLSETQANAIVSALYGESKLNPYAVNPKSGAIGISQWLGDRKYENGKLKVPITGNYFVDFVSQLEYLWNELTSTEKSVLDKIKNTQNFTEANHYFITEFLRPTLPESLGLKSVSNQILKKLNKKDEKFEEKLQSLYLKSFNIENIDEFIEYENKLMQAGKYGQTKVVSLLSAMEGQIDRNLLNDTMSGLASTMVFLPVGILTNGLAYALTGNVALSNTLGAVTSGVFEALNEAGSTYRMIVNDPKLSESSIRSKVLQNFVTDAIVTSIIDKIAWFNEKGAGALKKSFKENLWGTVGDYARVATGETLQEAMQQISQNLATDRPLFEGVPDVILPTILSSVAFKGFINTINGIERAYKDKISNLIENEEIRKIFNEAFQKAINEFETINAPQVEEPNAPAQTPLLPAPAQSTQIQYYQDLVKNLNIIAEAHPVKLKINNIKELNDYHNLIYSYIKRDEPIPIEALVYSDDWQIQKEIEYISETIIAPHNRRLNKPQKLELNLVSKALYGVNLSELKDVNDAYNVLYVYNDLLSKNISSISLTDIRDQYKQYYKIDPDRVQIANKDMFANAIYGLNYSDLTEAQKTHIGNIVAQILAKNQWAVSSINKIREKYYNGNYITIDDFINKDKISKIVYGKNYDQLDDIKKGNVDVFVSSYKENKIDISNYNTKIFSTTDFLNLFNNEIRHISETTHKISLLGGIDGLIDMYSKIRKFLYPTTPIVNKLENNEKFFLERLRKHLFDAGTIEIDLSVLYHFLKESPKIINTYKSEFLDKIAKEVANKIIDYYSVNNTGNINIEPINLPELIGGTEYAEETGTKTQETGKEEGIDRGEGERIHIRDTEKTGLETEQGEKKEGISTPQTPIDLTGIVGEQPEAKSSATTQPTAPQTGEEAGIPTTTTIETQEKEIKDTGRFIVGNKKTRLKTPNKFIPIEVKYAIVEADDLITSHKETQNFEPNPDYEKYGGFQPRDRSRQALQSQVYEIATNLQPEFLGASISTNQGSPVVKQVEDGRFLVESGNGRTMAIRLAYEYEGENYKKGIANYHSKLVKNDKYLKKLGFTDEQIQKINKMKKPVLVAIRTNEFLNEKQFEEYINDSNTTNIAEYSPFESAKSDAKILKENSELLESYNPNEDLDSPENKYFVDKYFDIIIPNNEKPRYVDSQGNYNTDLYNRIENALVYYAFQSDRLAIMFLEFAPFGRNIIKAISTIAVHIAKYRNSAFDLSQHLIDALNWVFTQSKVKAQDLYETYEDYANNYTPSMIEGSKDFIELNNISKTLANFLVKNRNKPTILKRFFIKFYDLLSKAEELINQPTLGFSTFDNPVEESIVTKLQDDFKNKNKSNDQKLFEYVTELIDNIDKLYLRKRGDTTKEPVTPPATPPETEAKQPIKKETEPVTLPETGTKQPIKKETEPVTTPEEKEKSEEKPAQPPVEEKSKPEKTPKLKGKNYTKDIDDIERELKDLEQKLKQLEDRSKVSPAIYKSATEGKGQETTISIEDEKRELLNKINLLKKIKRIKEFEAKYFNGKPIWEISENEFYKIQKKTNFEFGYNDILDYAVSEGIPEAIEFKKKLDKKRADIIEKINNKIKEYQNDVKNKLDNLFKDTINEGIKFLEKTEKIDEINDRLLKLIIIEAIKTHKTMFSDAQSLREYIASEVRKTLLGYEGMSKYKDQLQNVIANLYRWEYQNYDLYSRYKTLFYNLSDITNLLTYNSLVNEFRNSDEFIAQYIVDNLEAQYLSIYTGAKEDNKIYEKIFKLINRIENSAKDVDFKNSFLRSVVRRLIRFQVYNNLLYAKNLKPSILELYRTIGNKVVKELSEYISEKNPELKIINQILPSIFKSEYNKALSHTISEIGDYINNALKSYAKGILSSGQLVSLTKPELKVIGENYLPKNIKERVTKDKYGNENFRLDEHQLYGVNLMLHSLIDENNDGFLLGDGTGVGKTTQLLVTAQEYLEHKKKLEPNKKHRVLIVVPNAQIVEGSYKNDGRNLKISFIDASGAKQSDYKTLFSSKELPEGIIIINYNALNTKKDKMKLLLDNTFDLIIYDEAHSLKNFFSSRSMASQLLKSEKRIFVTATPTDKPHGFGYFLAHLIKRKPNVSFSEHLKQVMDAIGIEIYRMNDDHELYGFRVKGGITINEVIKRILEERNKLLKKGAYLRREYTFMGNIHEEYFDLTEEQKDAIDMCLYAIEAYYGDKIGNIILAQQRLLEIVKGNLLADKIIKEIKEDKEGRKFVISATMHSEDIDMTPLENVPAEALELLGIKLKQKIMTSAKYNPITRRKEDVVKLYTQSGLNVIREKLKKENIDFVEIYGDKPKGEAISEFKYNNKIRVALMTQASGGAGINLDDHIGDAPRKVWVLGFNWAGDQFEQLMGRFSRKTTRSFAEIIIPLNTSFGIETRLKNKVIEKLALLKSLQVGIDPDEYAIDLSSVSEVPEELAIMKNNQEVAESDNGASAYISQLTNNEGELNAINSGVSPQITDTQPAQASLTAGEPEQTSDEKQQSNIIALQDIAEFIINHLKSTKGYSVKTNRKLFQRIKAFHKLWRASGLYLPGGYVVIKSLQDFYVFLHEFTGHYIEDMFINISNVFRNEYRNVITDLLNEVKNFISSHSKLDINSYEEEFRKKYSNDIESQQIALHSELFAEFTVFYITDPELAQREAPNYYQFYEKMLDLAYERSGIDVKAVYEMARDLYSQYVNMSPKEFIESLRGQAKDKSGSWFLRLFSIANIKNLKKNLNKVYEEAIDSLFYFEKLSNILHKVAEKYNSNDFSQVARNFDEAFYKIKGLLGNEGKIKQFLNYNPYRYLEYKTQRRISGILKGDKYYNVDYEIIKQVDGLYHIYKPIVQAGLEEDFNTFSVAMRLKGIIEYIIQLKNEMNRLKNEFESGNLKETEYKKQIKDIVDEYTSSIQKIEPLYGLMPIRKSELNKLSNEEKFERFREYVRATIQEYLDNPAMDIVIKQHNQLMGFIDAIRKYLVSTGIISSELADHLRKIDPYYVPFFREFSEEEKLYSINRVGAGSVSNYVGSVIKPMKGSKRLILPIMENIIQYLSEAIINGERNIALKKLTWALNGLNSKIKVLKESAGTDEEANKLLDALTKEFKAIGISVDTGLIHPIAPPMATGVSFGGEKGLYYQIKGDLAEIKVREFGQNQYYVIPKEIFEAFFTVDQIDKPTITMVLMQTIPMIRRMSLTGLNLDFAVSNLISRDVFSALANAKYFINPAGYLKVIADMFGDRELYQDFLISGADLSFLTAIDERILKFYDERFFGKNKKYSTKMKSYLKNPLLILRDVAIASDLITRLNVFYNTLIKSGDIGLAMYEARRVTADYGMKGKSKFLNNYFALVAFLKPNILHTILSTKAMKNPTRIIMRFLPAVTIPTILNWAMIRLFGDDDDKEYYSRIPTWMKYRFWFVYIKPLHIFIPIPKGNVFAILFSSPVEALLDFALYNNRLNVSELVNAIYDGYAPYQSSQQFLPDALQILNLRETGYYGFYENPYIDDVWQKRFPVEYRFDPKTNLLIDNLVTKINLGLEKLKLTPLQTSSKTFQTTLRFLFGDYFDISSTILEELNLVPNSGNPKLDSYEIFGIDYKAFPIIKRMLKPKFPKIKSEEIVRFYDKLIELEGEYRGLINRLGNPSTENLDELFLKKYRNSDGSAKDLSIELGIYLHYSKDFNTLRRFLSTVKIFRQHIYDEKGQDALPLILTLDAVVYDATVDFMKNFEKAKQTIERNGGFSDLPMTLFSVDPMDYRMFSELVDQYIGFLTEIDKSVIRSEYPEYVKSLEFQKSLYQKSAEEIEKANNIIIKLLQSEIKKYRIKYGEKNIKGVNNER